MKTYKLVGYYDNGFDLLILTDNYSGALSCFNDYEDDLINNDIVRARYDYIKLLDGDVVLEEAIKLEECDKCGNYDINECSNGCVL